METAARQAGAVEFYVTLCLVGPSPRGGIEFTDIQRVLAVAPGETAGTVCERLRGLAEERYGSYLSGHNVVSFSVTPSVLVPVPVTLLDGTN